MSSGCFPIVDQYKDQNATFIRGDMTDNFLKKKFDIVLSDHVMQHVENIEKAFANLCRYSNTGGTIAINHYSRENNWLMVYVIEPLKKILFFVGPKQFWYLSIIPGTILYAIIKLIYKPVSFLSGGKHILPLSKTMMYWDKFNFFLVWITAYDLLSTPITYFRTINELLELYAKNKLSNVRHMDHAETFWCLAGTKTKSEENKA